MLYHVHVCYQQPKRHSGDHEQRFSWTQITRRPIGIDKARSMADEQDTRAVVQPSAGGEAAYRNAKPVAVAGTATPKATLPRIVVMLATHDSGEYGNASCPHCGADGRYIYTFKCDDGTRRGAMAGCIKLFPMHRFAERASKIMKREVEYKRTGRDLVSWDVEVLAAINGFADGIVDEAKVDEVIRRTDDARRAWHNRRRR